MAIKKLIEVWDGGKLIKDNISFLKEKTKDVYLPISSNDKKILKDLLDTYKKIPCAGIAANQIGYDKRIFIGLKIDEYDDNNESDDKQLNSKNPNYNNYEFYINPKIDQTYKKSLQEEEEGCLSIPEIRLIAERYDKIKVRYYDVNGKKIQKTFKGFLSRLFQHELDHLNGILMVENSKIKKVYRISDNEQIISLYSDLIEQVSQFN